MIQCSCPKCDYSYEVDEGLAGKTVLCPECQTRFKVKGFPRVRRQRDGEDNDGDNDRPARQGFPLWSLVLIPAGIIALCLAVGIGVAVHIASRQQEQQAQQVQQAEQEQSDSMPPDQAAFANLINDYAVRYRGAPNEIQKTELRFARAADLKKADYKTATNWVGTLKVLRTDQDGTTTAVFTVAGSKALSVGTSNNAFSDRRYGTRIARGSPLYAALSELLVGQAVVFSGEFFPGDRQDFLSEISITEKGSMTEPKFLMRFTAIRRK
jgi:hypothetical protein